jgi:hypothetical protein
MVAARLRNEEEEAGGEKNFGHWCRRKKWQMAKEGPRDHGPQDHPEWLMVGGLEQGGLELDAARGGVGEDQAGAESEGKARGFQGVAARCDVVDEVGLAER